MILPNSASVVFEQCIRYSKQRPDRRTSDYGQYNGVIKLLTWQAGRVKQRSATQLALDGN
jgi:hypothetical protein